MGKLSSASTIISTQVVSELMNLDSQHDSMESITHSSNPIINQNIGHIRVSDGTIQSLEDHLRGVAKLSELFASRIGISNVGRYIGLLHDLGKASSTFKEYVQGLSDSKRGDIDHSTAGAQYIFDKRLDWNRDNMYVCAAQQMMEMVIASHHSGLIDSISSEGTDVYRHRMKKDKEKTRLDEAVYRIDPLILKEVDDCKNDAEKELSELIRRIIEEARDDKVPDSGLFREALLERYILSCLVDADGIDTASFMDGKQLAVKHTDWTILRTRLYEHMQSLNNDDPISVLRSQISNQCYAAAGKPRGIYTLSAPTGSGKTLASLRFALEHVIHHGMERIVYVIPYTSVIEQNARVVKGIINSEPDDDYVAEIHSNIDIGVETEDDPLHWMPTDQWDSPIIFTTMVQFMDSLFSSGIRRARRMHNLVNSVIIFDEIQSLPVKTVYMFNEAINFLSKYCGCTCIMSTATQPLLGEGLEYSLSVSEHSEIIEDVADMFSAMRRTEISFPYGSNTVDKESLARLAADIMGTARSLLIIVNTKAMARDVYNAVRGLLPDNIDVYHLSTNMCAKHRMDVLDQIIPNLGKKPIVCVSTQLIEAGIDVDFEAVIRSMAGIDSIAQAAGRCNRNGRMPNPGKVYVVKTNESLSKLPDIFEGRRCTDGIVHSGGIDVLSPSTMSDYFREYFYRRSNEMGYPTDNPERSLFSMLSDNRAAVMMYKSSVGAAPESLLRQSFFEANSKFHLIDETSSIIIPYDDVANDCINRLNSTHDAMERSRIMRRLQRYSVNTFRLEEYKQRGVVYELEGCPGLYCLAYGHYDDEFGLSDDQTDKTLIL